MAYSKEGQQEAIAILQRAKENYQNGLNWCQKTAAKGKNGRFTLPGDTDTTAVCLSSAIDRAAQQLKREGLINYIVNNGHLIADKTIVIEGRKLDPDTFSIPSYNDKLGRTRKEIYQVLENSIKALKEEQTEENV